MLNWKIFRNNSFTLTALLAGVSFLLPGIAGGLSLFLVFLFGALISWKVPERKVRHAALLPVLPSLLLQLLYFSSQAVYYPGWLIVFMVLFNLATVIFFGFLGGLIPWYIDTRKNKDKEKAVEKKSSAKDQFQKNLNRLVSVIVLASFALQLVAVPVAAATQVSTDEYIQNYEPEQKTSISAKEIMPPPKNRAPKEGLNNLTPEQLKQYCLESGLAIGVTECAKFAPPPPPPVEQGYWENVFPEIVQNAGNKLSGKNGKKNTTKPTPAKSGKKQLTWQDQVVGFGKGIWDTGKELGGALIKMPIQGAKWIYDHPNQTLDAMGHISRYINPVTAPYEIYQGAKWVYNNRTTIVNTTKKLYEAGNKYGWTNVVGAALFSADAVDAWHRGEIGYAIGRGLSEFALNVVTLLPPVAAAKVPLVGEKLAAGINTLNKVNEFVTGVKIIEKAAAPVAKVLKAVPELMGVTRFTESTLAKASHSEPVINVLDTVVTHTAEVEYAQKTVNTAKKADIFDAFTGIENRAAKMSATQTATKTTAKEIAQMYETGKSYDTSMKYLSTGLKGETITAETATSYISTVSKNKGVQTLVSDTARPAVAQVMTEYVSHASPAEVKSLNTLGNGLEKSKQIPVAVKTFADGTSEVLAVTKKGEYTVNYVSKDGKLISNVYKPKAKGEEGFVHVFMGAEGGGGSAKVETAAKGAKNELKTLAPGEKSTYETEVSEIIGSKKPPQTPKQIEQTGKSLQQVIKNDVNSIAPQITAKTGKSTTETTQLIKAGSTKITANTKVENEVNKIVSNVQNVTGNKPEAAAHLYAAIGNYKGSDETLVKLLNKVKDEKGIKSLYTISNSHNLTYITKKATNSELSTLMNRIIKNGGENIYSVFKEGQIEHFIEGGINGQGNATGFHSTLSEKGTIFSEGKRNYNTGVFEGGVAVNDIGKTTNRGKSTFFPEDWGIIETLDNVAEAYNSPTRRVFQGNEYRSTVGKIEIGMYLDPNNFITSAFPVLP